MTTSLTELVALNIDGQRQVTDSLVFIDTQFFFEDKR
jgi:hypothetical protein